MVQIIDGKQIAQKIIEELKTRPKPDKILAAVLIGSAGSPQVATSENFLKQKEKIAKELGVDFRIYKFPQEIKNDDLRKEVLRISLLKKVGGVIVQLPLPEHINRHYILNVIPREKDIDVLGERALGAFYVGRNPVLPPAVGTIIEILKKENFVFSETCAAVVGCGFLVGKPIAVWLMNNKTKKLAIFEKNSDLTELKEYDLIISGIGQAGLIKPEMLKNNAVIIDFGGDFNSKPPITEYQPLKYTPTPGGAGPILVAKLFENFYKLNV